MTNLVCMSSRNTGDRGRVVFDVVDEGQRTSCDISHGALEKLGCRRIRRNGEALEIFAAFRDRIESIARKGTPSRPQGAVRLHLWNRPSEGGRVCAYWGR